MTARRLDPDDFAPADLFDHLAPPTRQERTMSTSTDRPAGSPAAESAAIDTRAALAATGNEALLRSYAALTHRIHELREEGAYSQKVSDRLAPQKADLRAQRDLIEAEVLRRMGGTA